MDRTPLTPGKLYARLSAEFRMLRPESCSSCSVPLPFVVERRDADAPNWELGNVPPVCEACRATVEDVASRASAFFDVYDPTASPRPPRH